MPFDSKTEADRFLRTGAYPNKATGQRPVRSYWCRKCRKWHVTSKPGRKNNG